MSGTDGGLGSLFDRHVAAEFEARDAEATMATMVENPTVVHVPVLTGGRGRDELHAFYRDRFIPSWPENVEVVQVSRTVGEDRVVDELIMQFTHSRVMPFWLPGVEPTGCRVSIPVVVVMGFEGDRIASEHVYWDQASLLCQVGLLEDAGLPVTGSVQARALQDPTVPLNELSAE